MKGHEDLIDALAIVKQRIPGVKCVFVGGPWGNAQHYFEQVQAYARHKVGDACVFWGYVMMFLHFIRSSIWLYIRLIQKMLGGG
ncbi:hypothetical protein ACFQMB_01660 [Pseudobowmanella zhangzhouensis]|uniref:hypothetical protein n=1 Tax=Pseudobowmanella zhangzhouensis TaxID=1537679 RepID=UPI003623AFB4